VRTFSARRYTHTCLSRHRYIDTAQRVILGITTMQPTAAVEFVLLRMIANSEVVYVFLPVGLEPRNTVTASFLKVQEPAGEDLHSTPLYTYMYLQT